MRGMAKELERCQVRGVLGAHTVQVEGCIRRVIRTLRLREPNPKADLGTPGQHTLGLQV